MGKKWEHIEVINLRMDDFNKEVYEQILEEVAGIIYSEICQLHKNSLSDSLTLKDELLKRTGTDA